MKIPFERTIAGAYRFAFSNILSIFGIGWLPFLLAGVICAGLVYALLPQINLLLSMESAQPAPAEIARRMLPFIATFPIFLVVIVIAAAMVNVGVMRKALGLHPAPVFVFFSLGAQVWRLIGAYLLLMVLAWGVALALALGIGAASFLLSKVSPGVQGLVTALLTVTAVVWAIYALVRVQFFLPAVVVAENRVGLGRSWQLGRGNFWRIVGIVLAVVLPVAVVVSIINQIVFQIALVPHLVASGPPADFPRQPVGPEEVRRLVKTMLATWISVWPYLAVMQLLQAIVSTGLSLGAVATAYNLVTGKADVTPMSGPEKAHV